MKSNKLIAEFMELETDDNGMYRYTTSVDDYATDDLSYFEYSWDWLMPVVAKITRDIRWRGNKYREYLIDVVHLGNIEYAYGAVVDFIEEYNKNQKKMGNTFEIYDEETNKTFHIEALDLESAENIASYIDFNDVLDNQIVTKEWLLYYLKTKPKQKKDE